MRELIFVDTETTGLDPEVDELIEVSWATRDSDVSTIWLGVTEVSEFIDDLIGFTKRGIAGRLSPQPDFEKFLKDSLGQTMVAANPAFDKAFLEAAGLWNFHYRMLDVESYAMAKLPDYLVPEVPGLKAVFDILVEHGYTFSVEPDHTSRNDVLAMREAFLFLEKL